MGFPYKINGLTKKSGIISNFFLKRVLRHKLLTVVSKSLQTKNLAVMHSCRNQTTPKMIILKPVFQVLAWIS